MSLAEKWKEYSIAQEQKFTDGGPIEKIFEQALQRAFYAGAEAAITQRPCDECEGFQAEIDHFRSHK